MQDGVRLGGRDLPAPVRLFVEPVQQGLHIPRMALEQRVNARDTLVGNAFAGLPEVFSDETAVRLFPDGAEVQERSALIKGPRGREKDVLHHVALAAREYEGRIRAFLDVGAQYGFHVLFRVTGDLLELVDGHQAGPVRRFEIGEQLLQRHLRPSYLPDADVEHRLAGHGVEFERRAQGADSGEESLGESPPPGLQRLEDMFAEQEYQLFERSRGVNIHEERVIAACNLLLVETVLDQPGLAHAPGRYDHRIAAVHERPRKLCGLRLAVAKVFCGDVTADNEGVSDCFHGLRMLCDFTLLQI